MNLSFENKVALVTGASSGMRLATARAFAEAGAAVVLADSREDLVRAEARKLVAAGHKAIATKCDTSEDAQWPQSVTVFNRKRCIGIGGGCLGALVAIVVVRVLVALWPGNLPRLRYSARCARPLFYNRHFIVEWSGVWTRADSADPFERS